MFYESELRFLCDVFHKNRVKAAVMEYEELIADLLKSDEDSTPEFVVADQAGALEALGSSAPHTLYNLKDSFRRCFSYLFLPEAAVPTVLYIGPYLSEMPTEKEIFEIGEQNRISPKKQKYLFEYYNGLSVISPESPLLVMLHTFCERIWKRPYFAIVDIDRPHQATDFPMNANETKSDNDFDDILLNMKTMEQRYAFENEMIRAVSLGQLHMESRLFSAFSAEAFEKRLSDPLRNAKNYGVIMNTLLRKAAESGGVHPFYIDHVSSEFAAKIEQMPSLSKNAELMCDMFRSYCRLVRKHSVRKYSPAVQKTILMIGYDLSAELSPALLAESQGISLGYLSTVFKRETGMTLSEYIREKRMEYAKHLLDTTNLQVQTIALHCGIMDVQYFSKIFKKHVGRTPKEYRETLRQSRQK